MTVRSAGRGRQTRFRTTVMDATFDNAVLPSLTYDKAYAYPVAGAAHPHRATSIDGFDITHDPNGNHIRIEYLACSLEWS